MSIYDFKTSNLKDFDLRNPLGVEKMAEDKIKELPVAKARNGTVCISKWKHENKDRTWFSFSIDNSYFDETEKKWKPKSSFSKNELIKVSICIDKLMIDDVAEK